uniref:Nucleoporin_N domain-containing protein n=1 Tax=Parastrongyloides trichosuri TaxID=131310 RepID=A0A0N4ZUQ7_PARTI
MYEPGETEFKFPSSQFAKNPSVKKIPIDISNISSQNVDVETHCGSFSFNNNGSVLDNRFIIWKSEGSNLFLQEYSTQRDLKFSSLCINVSPSVIIPGSQVTFINNILTITIPTQFSVQSLDLSLSEDMVGELKHVSVLKFFSTEEYVYKKLYNLKNQECAVKACVSTVSSSSSFIIAFLNIKNEAIVVRMIKNGTLYSKIDEFNLNSTKILEYFSRSTDDKKIFDLHTISTPEDNYIVTLHNNGIIKLWSCNSMNEIGRLSICDYFQTPLQNINKIYIKAATLNNENFAVIFVRSIQEKSFIGLFSISSDGFDFCCQSFIVSESLDHQDFIVFPVGETFDLGINLCILSKKSNTFTIDNDIPIRQPYIIEKCRINTKIPSETCRAKVIIPVTNPYDVPFLNDIIMEGESMEHTSFYKRIIFDKEVFSEDIVQKAVAINCKMNKKDVPLDDYLAIKAVIKNYTKSPKFKQEIIGTPNQKRLGSSLALSNNDIGVLNFWKKLLLSCYELQYCSNEAISLWKAENVGLFGAILPNQLTIVQNSDHILSNIIIDILKKNGIDNTPFSQIMKDINLQRKNIKAVNVIERSVNVKYLEVLCNELINSLCHLTVKPFELTNSVSTSNYIESTFTVELLSLVLRSLIGGRTYFTSRLLNIDQCIPKCQGKKVVNESEDMKRQLEQIKDLYGVLFRTLTLPFHNTSGCHAPSITLSTSFFKYLQKYQPKLVTKPLSFKNMKSYQTFIQLIINATVCSIYPASLNPVFLKYFIIEDKFEYLVEFIEKCNNQTPELKHTNLLCKGLAFVIGKNIDGALTNIIHALEGIAVKDLALNNLLRQFVIGEPHDDDFSYGEAILLLIKFFTSKSLYEISIKLGRHAIGSGKIVQEQLSSIYNALFLVYICNQDFLPALDCIRNITNDEERSTSLRQIIGILLQNNNRKIFLSLSTGNLAVTIMDYLEQIASDSDDLSSGEYYLFNVAFMTRRTKYLRAAYNMYHYASKLNQNMNSWQQLQKRCKALSEAKHLLSLSLEEKYLNISKDLSIIYSRHLLNTIKVTEEDIMKELLLSEARLALMDAYQTSSIPPEDKSILESELIRHNLFDMAWSIITYFKSSTKDFFKTVTEQCIFVDSTDSQGIPLWVSHNIKNLKDCLEMEGRHYMILKCYLEQHLASNNYDFEALRTILYVFLQYSWPAPSWLVEEFTRRNTPEYVRCLLEYNEIKLAYDTLLPTISKATQEIGVHKKHNPILPFSVIEQFLYFARKSNFSSAVNDIESKINDYFKKIKTVQAALKLY